MKHTTVVPLFLGSFVLFPVVCSAVINMSFDDTTTNWTATGPTYSEGGITLEFSNPANSSFRDQNSSLSVTNTSDSLLIGSNFFYTRTDVLEDEISGLQFQLKENSPVDPLLIYGMDDRDPNQAAFTELLTINSAETAQPGETIVVPFSGTSYRALYITAGRPGIGFSIDDVAVTVVPEVSLASLCTSLVGLCCAGFKRRR